MFYHVNKETGETGKCSAVKGKCPFGGSDEHFTSEDAARYYYEGLMSKGALAPQKKDGRSVRGAWADLEQYRKWIPDFSEVFVHPQGKIAFTTSRHHDRLTVFRNGKKASTSGTLADLRAGRGAWKQIKKSDERLLSNEEYEDQFKSNPTVSVNGKKVPLAKTLTELEQANVNAGYPKNSPYDPRAKTITEGPYSSPDDYNDTSSILPIQERGNPFKLKEMKPFEKLRFWNLETPAGKEYADSVFEVWEDGNGHYKAVASYGKQIPQLGSKAYFNHDQTHARMPGTWTLIGAFEPIEGGSIVGKVPNYSMPIYTYK